VTHLARKAAATCAALLAWLPALASSAELNIKVTNNQPSGGFTFSPVWVGIHDGTFDLFDPGSAASSQIEALAELASAGPLSALFAGHGVGKVLATTDAVPPFNPGETNSTNVSITDPTTTRFLSFGAMVVPSNDLFIGNPNPTAFELFNASGQFNGPLSIQIFGRNVWDAGTEVNDVFDGGAFIVGVDITQGTTEGGVAHLFLSDDPTSGAYLNSILGQSTPIGPITSIFGANDLLATIQISSVPEPSTFAMAGFGALAFTWKLRRKSNRIA
jgi:Spondin_N/PEP-CTERM motif